MTVTFDNVSRFYGEVLGVHGVTLSIPPGVTSLVGPNGSGKTTLMNLIAGLIRPTQGEVRVLGISPQRPDELLPVLGYCTQYDAFPRSLTGYQFLHAFLRMHGKAPAECDELARAALERVGLTEAAGRQVAAYSKGMRQRLKLAHAMAHEPRVLVLDEPLNGLDPMARADVIAMFREWGSQGRHVIVSSHILHEVDRISDQVVMLSQGYVVAEGRIQAVRGEVTDQPLQVLVRCDRPHALAARLFEQDHVVEARVHDDGRGLLVRTRDADRLYRMLHEVVLAAGVEVESVAPADEDVLSVYHYLIGPEGGSG